MHGRYYLIKTALLALALFSVGLTSGPYTQQMANEISQAHASALNFAQVAAANIRCEVSAELASLLHFFG